jgi:AcrR family transcriptional regulator
MANAQRDQILEAFLALLAEKPFETISLGDVAKRASVTLVELRREFGSTFDMLSAFMRDTDNKVLAGAADVESEESPARDRLFDVLMRRLETLAPHREAVRSLVHSARRNPAFALALNSLSVRSQQWMLAAARIDTAGVQGCIRAQGLSYVMARTLRVWLDDEDPGLARTMATLDRELANGERALNLMESFCRLVPRWPAPRRRRRRRPGGAESAAA